MSEVFNDYARYYDLLYKDKDYEAEATYIHGLIQRHKPGAKTILNLGCGTGKHDACLQRMGYQITGVDLSETMLVEARKRAIPGRLDFVKGDVRDVDLGKKFDVITSLFHVMSYQTMDQDVAAAFETVNRHLNPGGGFIFDFWHGEGVLKDLPEVRVKHLEDEMISVVRTAHPVMHFDRHVIDVNYEIMVTDKRSSRKSELREIHSMRYFFLPEIEKAFTHAGLSLMQASAWMSDQALALSWYGIVIARKKEGE